ncbi:MAG: metallophosphoesterase family protein [Polyangiaceae bacterium]
MGRTFAIGDIHGDEEALRLLLGRLPELFADDTLVFVGDYLDRGPRSAAVIEILRRLPDEVPAQVVCLRGNHEDAWLRIIDQGWTEFILPRNNGCLETLRSYQGRPPPGEDMPSRADIDAMTAGAFLPADVVAWMRALPHWFEDEHAIYVHAGIPKDESGQFAHPRDVEPKLALLWCRDKDFFLNYQGKLVVFGHTATEALPPELSSYTPEDPTDMWAGPFTVGLDTGCGKGGFLTALELPAMRVYESRPPRDA